MRPTIIKQNRNFLSEGLKMPEAKVVDLMTRTFSRSTSPIIKFSSISKNRVIEALGGQKSILDFKERYRFVDRDFKFFRLSGPSPVTPEIYVDVLEFTSDCSLFQIFHELTSDFKEIIMTQTQIVRFCELYPECLSQKYANFFLTKVREDYLAVYLYLDESGIRFHFNQFTREDRNNYWSYGNCKPRIVIRSLSANK